MRSADLHPFLPLPSLPWNLLSQLFPLFGLSHWERMLTTPTATLWTISFPLLLSVFTLCSWGLLDMFSSELTASNQQKVSSLSGWLLKVTGFWNPVCLMLLNSTPAFFYSCLRILAKCRSLSFVVLTLVGFQDSVSYSHGVSICPGHSAFSVCFCPQVCDPVWDRVLLKVGHLKDLLTSCKPTSELRSHAVLSV